MNDTTTAIHVCPTCHLAGQAIADERDACSLALSQWKPLAESLMGMIGDISNALGIDDESQETANGAGEILDALATLQAENARLALDLATMTEAALDRRASAQKACEAAEHIHAENARLQDEVNRLNMVEPTSRAGALLAQMHTDLADAQSQVARLVRERDDLRIEVVEADRLIATLKASKPDIEAVMVLADAYAAAHLRIALAEIQDRSAIMSSKAAREALRRSLTVGAGSGSEGRS